MPRLIAEIQTEVAKQFGLTRDELLSESRQARVAHPRAIAVAMARDITNASFPMLALHFNRSNHTTMINACRRARALLQRYPEYATRRDAALMSLQSKPSTQPI